MPELISSYVCLSSKGISSNLNDGLYFFNKFVAISNIERVFKPKKSNLTKPDNSVYFILNCVAGKLDLGSLYKGSISTKGLSPITKPAAWVAAFL